MPLLTSPIDGSPMKQISRYGVELDVCPSSGGVWLDKGELEKLMALFKEEVAAQEQDALLAREHALRERSYAGRRHGYDDDDDDDNGYAWRNGGGYRRKSKMSRIMDIFDF